MECAKNGHSYVTLSTSTVDNGLQSLYRVLRDLNGGHVCVEVSGGLRRGKKLLLRRC